MSNLNLTNVSHKTSKSVIVETIEAFLSCPQPGRYWKSYFSPENQCGFRTGRSTVDMIFTMQQLQEKAIKQH